MNKNSASRLHSIPNWLLLVLLLGQILFLISAVILPLANRTWWNRDGTAVERGARNTYGDDFTAYIQFLRTSIPDEALVVTPRQEEEPVFGHPGFMQYFLFPRELTNCPLQSTWEECSVNYGGSQTYILAVGEFPPSVDSVLNKDYIGFNNEQGLYKPK